MYLSEVLPGGGPYSLLVKANQSMRVSLYLFVINDINAGDVYSFIPESLPTGTEPKVVLLYRPGHYDILYR